jgi:AmmeMemoRadiSam system protein A
MESGKEGSAKGFSAAQGAVLIRLARQTLMARLGLDVDAGERAAVEKALEAPIFQAVRGTFVTLTMAGQLRGCIGHLTGIAAVVDSVRQNAVSAGFHDPRFAPLTAVELEDVEIEISILTEPRPLDYADAEDLIRRLRPQVDGVIIGHRGASATFLPQVWQQLPAPEAFLSHLCMKAGLSAERWRGGDLEVSTYQVQPFEEFA